MAPFDDGNADATGYREEDDANAVAVPQMVRKQRSALHGYHALPTS